MSACLFARVRVVAIIVAPAAFAIWNAAIPTLLDAAVTMTKSPVLSFACSISAPHAVTYCIQDAAANSNEILSGCLTDCEPGRWPILRRCPTGLYRSAGSNLQHRPA